MKKTSLFLCLLFCAAFVQAQTIDEVVNNYITKHGGLDKMKTLQTLHMDAETNFMNMGYMPTIIDYKNNVGYKQEIEANFGKITTLITPTASYYSKMGGGMEQMKQEDAFYYHDNLDLSNPIVDYKTKGNTLTLLTNEKVGDLDCYKIQCTLANTASIIYFVDTKDFNIVRKDTKMNMMGRVIDMSITYGDFIDEGGFMLPHKWEMQTQRGAITILVTKVSINPEMKDEFFVTAKG
jgi:hypothetical protein